MARAGPGALVGAIGVYRFVRGQLGRLALLAVAFALLTLTIATISSGDVATSTVRVERTNAPLDPADLLSAAVLRYLARRIGWHGSRESLQERLHVVQEGARSLRLTASAGGGISATDLLRGWTSSYLRIRKAEYVRLVTARANLISNAGFERGVDGWDAYNGNGGPTPRLTLTTRPRYVVSGRYALAVTADNPESTARLKLIWTHNVVRVRPRERYLLRARVSGAASRREPIVLGLRLLPQQAVTNAGMRRIGRGFEKTNAADRWLMEGLFTIPRGVAGVQLAIWQMTSPMSAHRFAVDAVALRLEYVPPAVLSRGIAAISRGLVVGTPTAQQSTARSVVLSAAIGLAGALLVLLLVPILRDRPISPAGNDDFSAAS